MYQNEGGIFHDCLHIVLLHVSKEHNMHILSHMMLIYDLLIYYQHVL